MVNIEDPRNYKLCQKKQYEIHVCMPPKGTVVFNKLEQADSIKMIGGREYFTVDELDRMKAQNPQKWQAIAGLVNSGRGYIVNEVTPFVMAGTLGEMWCVKPDKLASGYSFLNGGQPIRIDDSSLKQRCSGNCMDWQLIRSIPEASKAFACFVPVSQKGQVRTSKGTVLGYNMAGIKHGKGDFIIAQDNGGKPNISSVYVVNGVVFGNTYNNRGWTDNLDSRCLNTLRVSINQLPSLVTSSSSIKRSDYVYRQVAKKASMKWYGMDVKDAEKEAFTESIDTLESKVGASSTLNAAVVGLYRNAKMQFQGNIFDMIKLDDGSFEKKLKQDLGGKITPKHVIQVLNTIHVNWCKDNKEKFANPERVESRYQHLNTEFIGWEETKSDLLFLTPILKVIGAEYTNTQLEWLYWNFAKHILESQKSGSGAANPSIQRFIGGNKEITHDMIASCFVVGGVCSSFSDDELFGIVRNAPSVARLYGRGSTNATEELRNEDLYNYVYDLASKLAQWQHHELPMQVVKSKSSPDEILMRAKIIDDYQGKLSSSKFKTTTLETKIKVYKNNMVRFVVHSANAGNTKAHSNYRFQVPFNVNKDTEVNVDEVKSFLSSKAEVVFGMCGYVREQGAANCFKSTEPFTKLDYDGIRDYTMTSGATNRLLRGLGNMSGEENLGRYGIL